MKKKAQTIGQGFVILSVSNILVKLLSLIFVPLIRGLLGGDAGYSVYNSAYSVYAFVYVIATAGFPVAISKLISELSRTDKRKEAKRGFKFALLILAGLGLVLMALVMAFAKPIAGFMNNPDSWAGIMFLAPTVFVCSLLSGYRGYFQGRKNMRPTAVSQIIEQLVHVAVSAGLVIALKDKGIVWAVAGASVGTCVGALAALAVCLLEYKSDRKIFYEEISNEAVLRSKLGYRDIADRELLKRIFLYSLPLFISSAVQYGGDLIDSKMIKGGLVAAGLGEQTAKVLHGQYMAMRQLINVPGALATALCVTVLPIITSCFAAGDRKGVAANTQYSFKLCYLVAVPISFAYAVFSGPIYKMLGYGNNAVLLTVSSLSVILLCTIHLQSSVLQGVNRLFTASAFMCLCVVIKAVMNYFLLRIPQLNIYGAVISTYVSYLIPFILNMYVLKKRENIRFSVLAALTPPVIASTGCVAAGYAVYGVIRLIVRSFLKGYLGYAIAFIPAAVVAVIVYYIIIRKINGLTAEDIAQISPKASKLLGRVDKTLRIS